MVLQSSRFDPSYIGGYWPCLSVILVLHWRYGQLSDRVVEFKVNLARVTPHEDLQWGGGHAKVKMRQRKLG